MQSALLTKASLDPALFLEGASSRLGSARSSWAGPLRFGVDLGTATIVLCAVDAADEPVYWDFMQSRAVRDGVVVDFQDAVRCVRELKARAESALGVSVGSAATAHPPGVPVADCRACRYVLEQSDIACRELTDEISAAQRLAGIADGALVDVGGGSTGVGVFRDGELIALSDAPGGGHHLDLILAGAMRIAIEEAEARKRAGGAQIGEILRPGIERIADSVQRQIAARFVPAVHLVGGALMVPGAADAVSEYLGLPVVAYPHAYLMTPFGIALR